MPVLSSGHACIQACHALALSKAQLLEIQVWLQALCVNDSVLRLNALSRINERCLEMQQAKPTKKQATGDSSKKSKVLCVLPEAWFATKSILAKLSSHCLLLTACSEDSSTIVSTLMITSISQLSMPAVMLQRVHTCFDGCHQCYMQLCCVQLGSGPTST